MGRALKRCGTGFIAALLLIVVLALPLRAQDNGQIGQIFITGENTDTFPSVQLQVYGLDGQGGSVDFANESLFISHGGFPADVVTVEGKRPVGTLTVFLIDAPGGVAAQLPEIQAIIQQYSSSGNMQEQLDAVAIYQIGSDGPRELLAPTGFLNAISNTFTEPLAPEEGLTALVDSTLTLLDQIPALKPDPAMAASIVLISDGTDAVSTNEPGQIPIQAAVAGIPIHTIRLDNPELIVAGQELGRRYMTDVASSSRGVIAELSDPNSLTAIWDRIGSFRDQTLLRYTVPEPASGTFPVELSLVDDPDMRAMTEVTVSAAAPSVIINLPFDSRTMTLPALDEPIDLRLSTTVSWLDGETREIVLAEMLVNGQSAGEIPVGQLADFTLPVANLVYGANEIEVVVTDNQNLQASSGPTTISVSEGELTVPEELQPEGLPSYALPAAAVGGILLLLLAGVILWQRAQTRGSRRRRSTVPPADSGDPPGEKPSTSSATAGQTFIMAHLQVLEAQSVLPDDFNLGELEVKLGRSPTQCDIAFRDDITVSRYHAVMRLEGNHYRIYDAGSTSGTFVNGRPTPDYGIELTNGDEINLGAVRLRFHQL